MEYKQIYQEKIEWEKYPNVKWYDLKEDVVVTEKFPAAEIIALERRQQKTKGQKWLDWFCCFCTDAPDGGADFFNALEDMTQYYLVKGEGNYLLVNVGKEDIVAWEISCAIAEQKKIAFGKNYFYKTRRKVKGYGKEK